MLHLLLGDALADGFGIPSNRIKKPRAQIGGINMM